MKAETQAMPARRVWAEVDLDALVFNYEQAQKAAPASTVMCVVKGDAYGHGAPQVSRALAAAGCRHFAVATPEEAVQLRRHGIEGQILLLGMAPGRWAPEMARLGVDMAVGTPECAAEYAAALADAAAPPLGVHLKIDTGLNRIGQPYGGAVAGALAIAATPGFRLEGVFTHFAVADDGAEDAFTTAQIEHFNAACAALERAGLTLPPRHCANSAGLISHPAANMAMVRPGIMLYGVNPTTTPIPLRPTFSLRSRVVQVKPLAEGESVSYGRTWVAPRPSVIATLGVGYADGLLRCLSDRLEVLIRSKKAPIIGRICMDMCMVDVTGVPGVQPGDTATLIGADGGAVVTIDEMAELAGTITYEVFCAIGRRVPRVWTRGGQVMDTACYIDAL